MVDPRSSRSLRWHGSDELPVGGDVNRTPPVLKRAASSQIIELVGPRYLDGGDPTGRYSCAERRYFFARPAQGLELLSGRFAH